MWVGGGGECAERMRDDGVWGGSVCEECVCVCVECVWVGGGVWREGVREGECEGEEGRGERKGGSLTGCNGRCKSQLIHCLFPVSSDCLENSSVVGLQTL